MTANFLFGSITLEEIKKISKIWQVINIKIFRTKYNRLNYWLEVLLAACLLAAILYMVLWTAVIRGCSMAPALNDGDIIIISRFAARFGNFSHGDLVMCRIPVFGHNETVIKRIAAVPGDRVQVISGALYINDQRLALADFSFEHSIDITLGVHEYFILGDNAAVRQDRRLGV